MYSLALYEKAMPDALPIEEKLQTAKELGYDSCELCIDQNPERAARLDWSKAERRALAGFMFDNDIRLTTLSLSLLRSYPLGTLDADANRKAFALLEKGLDLADDLGAGILLVNGYDVYETPSTPETAARFAQNLPIAVAMAARRGIIIGIENAEKPFVDRIAKAAYWVGQVDSPYCCIYGDVANSYNAFGGDTAAVLADMETGRGKMAAMHLKDSLPGEYRFTRYGEGHVDFEAAVPVIHRLGVRIFTAELFLQPAFDWREEAARVNRFLRGHLDRVYQGLP